MTREQMVLYLEFHPRMKACPNCGGAGEFPWPLRGEVIECTACRGAGVVPKEPWEA